MTPPPGARPRWPMACAALVAALGALVWLSAKVAEFGAAAGESTDASQRAIIIAEPSAGDSWIAFDGRLGLGICLVASLALVVLVVRRPAR